MQDLFELTPELLLAQSQEMLSLCSAYESLFGNIASDLNGINSSWSDLLSNNFSGKIGSAQKAFTGALTMLRNSANSIRIVAETSQEMDTAWASRISGTTDLTGNTGVAAHVPDDGILTDNKTVDIGDYCSKVTDAEYAKLCQYWQRTDEAYGGENAAAMGETFLALLRENLPENDPLHDLTTDQIRVTTSPSGFSAVTILDGDNAIVVFAGTDFSKANDVATDANILLGQASVQSAEANILINELSKEYSNIVVTGHSLGGYLATSATLGNGAVSECITFDPPGRQDSLLQNVLNQGQVSKIRTYKAKGSPVSSELLGHKAMGTVVKLDVEKEDNPCNHGIKQISEALEKYEKEELGKKTISENWN